ncbi:MAG: GPH family glycoside/pentoside/hexuronide:cation symporter [Candidatus Paceibacteria bacterium]|jgi:GPH family glycoside/pentoside/hexuronide:cation symporter
MADSAVISEQADPGRLSTAMVLGYSTGNFGFALLGLVVAVNLQYFYTDFVGLSAGLVAWSLLFARLFDSVTDPVMGYLSDRTHTRFGRRRPYIVGAAIPLALAFYFLFSPPVFDNPADEQGYLLFYMLSLYIMTYFIWTVGAIPYFSLGAELTDDYHGRVKVIAIRETCALVGLLAATILPAYLIYVYGGIQGYSFMGAILGGGVAICLLFSGVVSKERAEFQGRPAMNPYAGWLATFANPHFKRLLIAFVLSSIAAAVPAVLIIYVSVYIIGTPEWWVAAVPGWLPTWSYYLLIYFFAGIISLPFWNRLALAIGKRNTWLTAILISTCTSSACWWLSDGSVGFFTIILVFGGFAFGNFLALPPSMVADVIDWDEVETGKRREGSYFAIWAFTTKLGAAITGFASLQVLEYVGYTPGVAQTELVKTSMLWMYSWFPALFYLLSAVALLRFTFTREELRQVQDKLTRIDKA